MAKRNEQFEINALNETAAENISNNGAEEIVEQLRIALAKLGLKIIDDINDKRVVKPEETYNSLVALYNAVKKS